jgi:predicted PurR-regulated permease PerM
MAEPHQRLWIHVPWSTLLKIIAALALVWLWQQLVWVVMLVLVAIIIAVGLEPTVSWLERRSCPRWLAAIGIVALIVGVLIGFLALSWSSLAAQAQNLESQLRVIEQDAMTRVPPWILEALTRSRAANASLLTPYALSFARALLSAAAAFLLAWILVVYLLIEAEPTYRWIRGFVPERLRARFDQTAVEGREVAFGYIVGNAITSVCAGVYFFFWLSVLGVPAALLLAVLAFFTDFIPVLGFYLSCAPAMAMAATRSTTITLAMIPIYLAYHFIENYVIGPRVYAGRLRLSGLAVLVAFAVGAELGGVIGALIALPIAAVYPTVERLWLRRAFGGDVVDEHRAIANE